MAVLSDAATGTTILLALPMGEQKDASSTGVGDGSGEEAGKSAQAGEEECVEQESESQGGTEGPASTTAALPQSLPHSLPHAAAASQPTSPPQQAAATQPASPLVRARTFPEVELERAVGEAERVVRGVVAGRGVAVVDDNAVNRMVARRTLQGYGAHVLLLPSGEDALQALSSAAPSPPIHLLLLDLHMPPGIDGFETARRVRALENAQQMKVETNAAEICEVADTRVDDASKQRLCIIALTADLDAGIKRACLEVGMDGAVSKPIVAQELAAALSAAGLVHIL
ncbi:unnamed protein product [Closterium sp. NIES-65]|nr:unnamed protein product [Closterium sp. NIES-65]